MSPSSWTATDDGPSAAGIAASSATSAARRRVKAVVREADRLGVKVLTLYAFSTENWTRPETELQVLWKLLKKYLLREVDELDRNNVRMLRDRRKRAPGAGPARGVDPVVRRLSKNTGLAARVRDFLRLPARAGARAAQAFRAGLREGPREARGHDRRDDAAQISLDLATWASSTKSI